jgi:alkyl hydroperoxide reductase subunit D
MNGCGMCMDAHVAQAEKHGISKQGVQQTIKIGALVAALAQALVIAKL